MDGQNFKEHWLGKKMETKIDPFNVAQTLLTEQERKKIINETKKNTITRVRQESFESLAEDFLDYSHKVLRSISNRGQYSKVDFNLYSSTAAAYYKGMDLLYTDKYSKLMNGVYNILHRDNFKTFGNDLRKIIQLLEDNL